MSPPKFWSKNSYQIVYSPTRKLYNMSSCYNTRFMPIQSTFVVHVWTSVSEVDTSQMDCYSREGNVRLSARVFLDFSKLFILQIDMTIM